MPLTAALLVHFQHVYTIIIDEISMVSASMLTYISRRLSEIKVDDMPFGGVNIIAVGDFFQLRPVNGRFAFKNLLLWHLFTPIFLEQNMRQSKDCAYAALLNRARVGQLTDTDIHMLSTRLSDAVTAPEDTMRLYPLRAAVNKYNSEKLNTMNAEIITCSALHYFGQNDFEPGSDVPNHFLNQNGSLGGLPMDLALCIGARVMLTRNIMTDEGLVNGALGRVHSFIYDCDDQVETVNVLFDDSNIGKVLKVSGHECVGIDRIEFPHMVHGRTIIRSQFPLMLSWACTIHKVQGLSLTHAVVDLGTTVFERGMAYVALSRVTTLSGLYILKLNPAIIQPPSGVLEENSRLRNIID